MSSTSYLLMPGRYADIYVTRDINLVKVKLYDTPLIEMDLTRGIVLFFLHDLPESSKTQSTINCCNRFMILVDDHRRFSRSQGNIFLSDTKRRLSTTVGKKPLAISISGRQMIIALIKLGILLPTIFDRKEHHNETEIPF